ncbi:hypothetical protein ACTMU2_07915 [Cupriavidus basilensis]
MDIIAQFIGRYRREFDFFEQAGRIVAQQLEIQLESSGIRAMVTFRAKNPKRLEAKVRQRDAKKNTNQSTTSSRTLLTWQESESPCTSPLSGWK